MSRMLFAGLLAMNAAVGLAQPPLPEVIVDEAAVRLVSDRATVAGRLEAADRVELRARVSGYLEQIHVEEGSLVRRGALLFQIDHRPYTAQLGVAQAKVAVSQAAVQLAKANLDRLKATFAAPAGPTRQELDKAQSDLTDAAAALDVAKAHVESARLQLDFTKIIAPIDGVIGRKLVSPGSLVKADETLLNVLVSREPMRFVLDLPEATLLRLQKSMRDRKLDGKDLTVSLGLAHEDHFPYAAIIDFIDIEANPKTGTVALRGHLPKSVGLIPGLSLRGRLVLGPPYRSLTIPTAAILRRDVDGKTESFVFIVKNNTLALQLVEVGPIYGVLTAITTGLNADDLVVLNPSPALTPGMSIRMKQLPTSK